MRPLYARVELIPVSPEVRRPSSLSLNRTEQRGKVMAGKHKTIDAYIADCSDTVKPLLTELRAFIHETLPDATEDMRYGAPYFLNAHGVPVIYLFGSRAHVNFGFLQSSEMSDPRHVLRGSGTPSKHVRVFPEKPYDKALLTGFIQQCESMQS